MRGSMLPLQHKPLLLHPHVEWGPLSAVHGFRHRGQNWRARQQTCATRSEEDVHKKTLSVNGDQNGAGKKNLTLSAHRRPKAPKVLLYTLPENKCEQTTTHLHTPAPSTVAVPLVKHIHKQAHLKKKYLAEDTAAAGSRRVPAIKNLRLKNERSQI